MGVQRYRLSPREQFDRIGFYRHDEPVVEQGLLARSRQALAEIRQGVYATGRPLLGRNWNPGDDESILAKLDNAHVSNRALLDAIVDSGIGELAGEVTGADWVQAWVVQGLYKPPSAAPTNKSNVGWHQDQTYWDELWEDGSVLLTAWLALTDVALESGPMRFVPQSHTWGPLDGSFFEQDQEANRANIRLPEGAVWSEVANVLPAGGVSFHHQWLVHGSHQNVSPGPRMSMAIHLRTERSSPKSRTHVLTKDLDDPDVCPVIFRR